MTVPKFAYLAVERLPHNYTSELWGVTEFQEALEVRRGFEDIPAQDWVKTWTEISDHYAREWNCHFARLGKTDFDLYAPIDAPYFVLTELALRRGEAERVLAECAVTGQFWQGINDTIDVGLLTQIHTGTAVISKAFGQQLLRMGFPFMDFEEMSFDHLSGTLQNYFALSLEDEVEAIESRLQLCWPKRYKKMGDWKEAAAKLAP